MGGALITGEPQRQAMNAPLCLDTDTLFCDMVTRAQQTLCLTTALSTFPFIRANPSVAICCLSLLQGSLYALLSVFRVSLSKCPLVWWWFRTDWRSLIQIPLRPGSRPECWQVPMDLWPLLCRMQGLSSYGPSLCFPEFLIF